MSVFCLGLPICIDQIEEEDLDEGEGEGEDLGEDEGEGEDLEEEEGEEEDEGEADVTRELAREWLRA